MKILYDYQIFGWQQYGGISRYFCEISNAIAALKGNDVEIFAPFYVSECFRDDNLIQPTGAKLKHRAFAQPLVSRIDLAASWLARPFRRGVDVFHETYYSMADCCPRSAVRILTVFDMINERYPAMMPRGDTTHKRKARAVQRADHIICISENTRHDVIEILGVPQHKISVAYLGHSLVTRQQTPIPSSVRRPYILYVGLRGGYKNFEAFIRAFAGSPSLKKEYSIVCFGGGKATPQELTLSKSLGLAPSSIVYVTGQDEVLAGLYSAASVFVYPSLYEGFGIPPLEAMAYGCPVACSGTSSLPEVVGDAAELFDPTDQMEIRGAIERVLSDSNKSSQMVARGNDRISKFTWQKCAQQTLSIYRTAIENRSN